MARILAGWEFGGGLGHLTRLLPVVEGMLDDGHEVFLAVQALPSARSLLEGRDLPKDRLTVLQAPAWPMPVGPEVRKIPTHSFADVLKIFSFHDPALLSAMAEGWRGLLRTVKPDLVVAEFSPTLKLAAGQDVPVVVTGNGYTVPPTGRPLPPIRPWEKELPDFSVRAETEILEEVHGVQKALGQPPSPHLVDLLTGEKTFICTIPEFDPYGAYRSTPTLMPFNLPEITQAPKVEDRPPRRLFVYLPANHTHLPPVLTALGATKLECDIYVPRLPAKARDKFDKRNLRFHETPLDLNEILPKVRAIVHHCGLSTAYTALLAGTPQLVMTNNLEHLVTAYGLNKFKSSIVMRGNNKPKPEAVAGHIKELFTKPQYGEAAQAAVAKLADRPRGDGVGEILRGCRDLLP